MADKATLLRYIETAADRTRATEDRSVAAKAERDQLILAAQQAGATYPELARWSGLTADRVKQVLAAQRRLAAYGPAAVPRG